jgi:ribosomal protein L12E/L44/L45/RPP1/RPP2
MDPEQIKALIEAIKNKDGDAALAIAEAMLVSAASGNAAEEAAEGEPVAADALAASAEPKPPSPEEKALESALTLLTGAEGPAERTVFLTKLIEDRKAHAERAATLELSSRFELVGELVKLGIEFPSTAYVGDPADRKLVARLSAEPIAELRDRVAVLKKAKVTAITPPARKEAAPADGGRAFTTSHGVVTLSASEIKSCEEMGAKPESYAENKAIREAARAAKGSK